jgi:hypothetical protein
VRQTVIPETTVETTVRKPSLKELAAQVTERHAAEGKEAEATAHREVRQAKVERELRAHPERQRAFDVADALLDAARGDPVSMVLAIRHGAQILSGELHIPRERWDLAAFVAVMNSPERQQ